MEVCLQIRQRRTKYANTSEGLMKVYLMKVYLPEEDPWRADEGMSPSRTTHKGLMKVCL